MSAGATAGLRVGIVVLNWNGLADTLECLASLAAVTFRDLDVIVVDNGSREDPTAIIRERFPRFRCVRTSVNLGISSGNDLGIRAALQAGASHVVLLNNDVVVAQDFIDHLVSACEADPRVGIAGSLIMYYDRPERIQVAGFSFNERTALKVRVPGGRVTVRGEDEPERGQFGPAEEVLAVSGCSMLIRRQVVEAVGGQDRRFYVYFQDIEFCLRAARAGFKTVLVPSSRIWHKGGRDTAAAWGRQSARHLYWYVKDLAVLSRERLGLPLFLYQWVLVTGRGALERRRPSQALAFLGGSLAGLATGLVRRPSVEMG